MKTQTNIVTRRNQINQSLSKQTPVCTQPLEIKEDLPLFSNTCTKNLQNSAQTAQTAPTISNHKKSGGKAFPLATPSSKIIANHFPLRNKTNTKTDNHKQVSSFLEIESKKEYHENASPDPFVSASKRRNPLIDIENHPLLNSKSKCRSLIMVDKKLCEVGDSELPKKFQSPHSDNEELPESICHARLDSKFNNKKDLRRANSRFSEAINNIELNFQPSLIQDDKEMKDANEPINSIMNHKVKINKMPLDLSDVSIFSSRIRKQQSIYENNQASETFENNQSVITFTQHDDLNGASASFFEANDSKYNRKEKSLGELCRRFLSIYGKEEKDLLLLDQCTKELGVERRRIYDIINILESFCVIRRQAKNSYLWRGIDRIVHSIKDQIERSENFKNRVPGCFGLDKQNSSSQYNKENQNTFVNSSKSRGGMRAFGTGLDLNRDPDFEEMDQISVMSSQIMPSFINLQSDEEEKQLARQNGCKLKRYKKEKSLGILCQQFIHLFVTWKHVISLEEAAKKISLSEQPDKGEDQKEQKLKTKIRRLYDIANVLQSIGLIEKCHAVNSKKPAFKWIGLHGTITQINEVKFLNSQYLKMKKKHSCNTMLNREGGVSNQSLGNTRNICQNLQVQYYDSIQSEFNHINHEVSRSKLIQQPEKQTQINQNQFETTSMLDVVPTQMRFDKPSLDKQASLLDKRSFNRALKSQKHLGLSTQAKQVIQDDLQIDFSNTKVSKAKMPKIMDRMRDIVITSDMNDSAQGSPKLVNNLSSSPTGSGALPPRTINPEQEDEIVKQLEMEQRQRLEEDPMKELNEALMDRTTAGKNRRSKIMAIKESDCSLDSDKQSTSENHHGSLVDLKPVRIEILSNASSSIIKHKTSTGKNQNDVNSGKSSNASSSSQEIKKRTLKQMHKSKSLSGSSGGSEDKIKIERSAVQSDEYMSSPAQNYNQVHSNFENQKPRQQQNTAYQIENNFNFTGLSPQAIQPQLDDFKTKSEWVQSKMKHDLVILNNFVRPQPIFKSQNGLSKKKKTRKQVNSISTENDSFNNISQKMLGLSNMINLMNAYQFCQMSAINQQKSRETNNSMLTDVRNSRESFTI